MNFSQSTIVVSYLYDVLKYHHEFKLKEGLYLPYFVVNFSPLRFWNLTYKINGKMMPSNEYMHDIFSPG